MAIGKYTSLEEAKDEKKLKRFIKEHPSKGNEKKFDDMLGRMAKNKPMKKPAK